MIEENIGVCSILEFDNKEYNLVFSDFGDYELYPDNLRELCGNDEAGGEEWERIVRAAFKLEGVKISDISFDSESDLFSIMSKNHGALVAIANLINGLLKEPKHLLKATQYAIKIESQKPAITVEINDKGWVRCPKCHFQFKPIDKEVWSGKKHLSCGQALIIV